MRKVYGEVSCTTGMNTASDCWWASQAESGPAPSLGRLFWGGGACSSGNCIPQYSQCVPQLGWWWSSSFSCDPPSVQHQQGSRCIWTPRALCWGSTGGPHRRDQRWCPEVNHKVYKSFNKLFPIQHIMNYGLQNCSVWNFNWINVVQVWNLKVIPDLSYYPT